MYLVSIQIMSAIKCIHTDGTTVALQSLQESGTGPKEDAKWEYPKIGYWLGACAS